MMSEENDIYALENFENKLAEEYVCGICKNVLKMAQRLCNEEHLFCKECINSLFDNSYDNKVSCPLCNQENITKTMVQTAKYANRIINKLEVKCIYNGCNAKHIALSSWPHHQNNICNFNIVNCPQKCGETFQKKNEKKHLKMCKYNDFFKKSLTTLFDIKNDTIATIPEKIVDYYDKKYPNLGFCALISNEKDSCLYSFTYDVPFWRNETIGKTMFNIFGSKYIVKDRTKGEHISPEMFNAFAEGLIRNYHIKNGKTVSDVKTALETAFGGSYLVCKNARGWFIHYYLRHYSVFKIDDDEYFVARIG